MFAVIIISGKSVTDALVQWLEPLFLQYDVDMYFCGHVHWYERMYPVAQGQITQKDYNNPTVPVYIVNGAGGNVEGHEGTDKNHFPAYQALWNNEDFGFGQLSIQSPNQLQWTFYRGADLTVLDHITLVKNVHANKVKL
jgi:acid phosphatase